MNRDNCRRASAQSKTYNSSPHSELDSLPGTTRRGEVSVTGQLRQPWSAGKALAGFAEREIHQPGPSLRIERRTTSH